MTLQIASASVLGRDHVGPGKNNQDALHVVSDHGTIIAVVCDGCGSGAHSEVGAKIGARLVCESISRHMWFAFKDAAGDPTLIDRALERVRLDVLAQIRVLANAMGGSFSGVVQDYFLFTIIGAIVNDCFAVTFSIGDGVVYRDGERVEIWKSEYNAPPYVAYALVETTGGETQFVKDVHVPHFVVHGIQAGGFSSLLIGTDGAEALIAASEQRMPGRQDSVGPIESLWTDDRFFQNKDALRRHLVLVNREHQRIDWKQQVVHKEHGLLKDDASLVVIRRVP